VRARYFLAVSPEEEKHLAGSPSDPRAQYEEFWQRVLPCRQCLDGPEGDALRRERSERVFFPLPGLGVMPSPRPVRFLVLGSEPSGNWARDPVTGAATTRQAEAMVRGSDGLLPFRNFNEQRGDWLFQYAAEHWLIDAAVESYVMSDVAKCALDLDVARRTKSRYGICIKQWLAPELALLKPSALIALGASAKAALDGHPVSLNGLPVFAVPHPSFANLGRIHQLLPKAEGDLRKAMERVPDDVWDFIRARRALSRQTGRGHAAVTASEGDRKFLVAYQVAFADIREQLNLRPFS
jgi:hypothetical protein